MNPSVVWSIHVLGGAFYLVTCPDAWDADTVVVYWREAMCKRNGFADVSKMPREYRVIYTKKLGEIDFDLPGRRR